MIFGPNSNYPVQRIRPIDPDFQDDRKEERKRKVLYQGRAWAESEDEEPISIKKAIPQTPSPEKLKQQSSLAGGVYADRLLLEKAQSLFKSLTTLEERAAQLCFLSTEAIYDSDKQYQVELLIQTWQFGGLHFTQGDYRRQSYLIERYQAISKTPLLMSNAFLHGLSFYLQGSSPQAPLIDQHFLDLGKAVMAQNRRLGVHIQFDRKRRSEQAAFQVSMEEQQAKAFRKGVREGQGIVGKEKISSQEATKGNFPFLSQNSSLITSFTECQVQETLGFKTLTFFDATDLTQADFDQSFLEAFKQLYDVFLLSDYIPEAIRAIARLVRSGKISEEIFDKHVMKALIIKSLFKA